MNTLIKKNMQIVELTCTSKADATYFLKVTVAQNERGIFFKVTSVLFAHGWDIEEVVAETIEGRLVKDIFVIRNLQGLKMTEQDLFQIKSEIYSLLNDEISVLEYLKKSTKDVNSYKKPCNSTVQLFNPPSISSTVLDIRTLDRPGLLYEISQILFLSNIDIISVTAKTGNKEIRDSFLLCTPERDRLTEEECYTLKQKLLAILS